MDGFDSFFVHLPCHRIILCNGCQYAVPPQQIIAHLRAHHAIGSLEAARTISAYAQSLDNVAQTPKDVCYLLLGGKPVPGLPVQEQGLECTGNTDRAGCGYICQTKAAMQQHCREEHGWRSAKGRGGSRRTRVQADPNQMWTEGVSFQVLFEYPQWKKGFRVQPPEQEALQALAQAKAWQRQVLGSTEHMAEEVLHSLAVLEEERAERTAQLGTGVTHKTEVSPWLDRTRWMAYFQDQELGDILALAEKPHLTSEPALVAITDALDSLIEAAYHSVCEDKINYFAQRRISSFLPKKAYYNKPLVVKLQKNTYAKYKDIWKRLLCFVCRSARLGEQCQLPHCLTSQQTALLDSLLAEPDHVPATATGSQGESRVQLYRLCLDFCIALLDHQLNSSLYDSIVIGFLAVLGVAPDTMTFQQPLSIIPHPAGGRLGEDGCANLI